MLEWRTTAETGVSAVLQADMLAGTELVTEPLSLRIRRITRRHLIQSSAVV